MDPGQKLLILFVTSGLAFVALFSWYYASRPRRAGFAVALSQSLLWLITLLILLEVPKDPRGWAGYLFVVFGFLSTLLSVAGGMGTTLGLQWAQARGWGRAGQILSAEVGAVVAGATSLYLWAWARFKAVRHVTGTPI